MPAKKKSTSKKSSPGVLAERVETLRERIDSIDGQLIKLLARRGTCVEKIGEHKRAQNLTFHAPARERDLLKRITKANPGPYSDEAVETIFREIMSASLALESPLTVAFGATSKSAREAIRRRFGRSARLRREKSTREALAAVEAGWADYAVVDVEDDVNGFHGPELDALCDTGAPVTGEIVAGTGRRERFLIVGGQPQAPTGNDRTSAVFVVRHEPGSLLRLLGEFSSREVNLTCIESRPLPGQSWQYRFFVDMDGHQNVEPLAGALAALEDKASVYRVLGSYPKGW